jgi:hypothetical protein
MSNTPTEDLIYDEHEQAHGGKLQEHVIPLATENSPEETIKRMRAFPERAAKFRELIRALREADAR